MKTVYLNGKYMPINEAKISVLDRGFLFGDGIYEVIPAYNSKIFRFSEHLRRLKKSLSAVLIANPYSDEQWQNIFQTVLEKNSAQGPDQVLYLEVTRGAPELRHHNIPKDIEPTVFVQSSTIPEHDIETLKKGKKAITLPDSRWDRCNIKCVSLLANVLLNQQAKDAGAEEAILINDGIAVEGSSSNLFIVVSGTIVTPIADDRILGGITRELVIELAKANDIEVKEQDIDESMLSSADEIWITSSTRQIFPITTLNNRNVADGNPGPLWQKMLRLFRNYIHENHHV